MSSKTLKLSSEQRKRAIAQAAFPLFAKLGLNGCTTKAIAKAAGVSEALIYKHYPSKEAIYQEIQDLCCSESLSSAEKLVNLEPGLDTLIAGIHLMSYSILKGFGNDSKHNPLLKRILLHSLNEDGEFARNFIGQKMQPWIQPLQQCLKIIHQNGQSHFLSEQSHLHIWFSHHSAVIASLMLLHEKPIIDYKADLDTLIHEHTKFSLRGIGIKEEIISEFYKPETFDLLLKISHQEPL